MKNRIIIFALVVFWIIAFIKTGLAAMEVTSPDFEANAMIPAKFTCQGENISPALRINNIPEGTKSLVLIVDDPDAATGTWVHWVVYNIDPVETIVQGEIPGAQGINDFNKLNYGGPCPPSGTHRYFFKVYALDTKLDLESGLSKQAVLAVMKRRVLDQAVLMGLYKKE